MKKDKNNKIEFSFKVEDLFNLSYKNEDTFLVLDRLCKNQGDSNSDITSIFNL